ncbi:MULTISPECIES: PaaI family thioesterase [unclassified Streptomyces]|uniref:PaaI family thioesterase n=1 Tax=Streptomyces sp. NBC_00060 TaxID=2975636 RepID=A0AAU2H910_9ACTN
MPDLHLTPPTGFPAPLVPTRHRRTLDEIVAGTARKAPCVEHLRLPGIEGWEYGRVHGRATVPADYLGDHGVVFGGYIASLADQFCALAVLTCLPDTHDFLTAELNTKFRRPLSTEPTLITAEVTELTSRYAIATVKISQNDAVAAEATATQILRSVA